MKLYILFGQRKGNYPGQYAPEALAIMDEYGNDENPDYIADLYDERRKDSEFEAVRIIAVKVSQDKIQELLRDEVPEIVGEVEE